MSHNPFSHFFEQLNDAEFAKSFLLYCLERGYQFKDSELATKEDIKKLTPGKAIKISKSLYPTCYLLDAKCPNELIN